VIASVEALCYHRQFLEEQQDGYGQNVFERLQTGRRHDAVDLAEAFFTRRKIGRVLAEVFEEVDCLVGATIPCLPPALGSSSIDVSGTEEGIVDALVRMNAAQNMAGVPALSLPCGLSSASIPLSMQLIAASGKDQLLLRLGHFFQSVTDWHLQKPPKG
jgi:Asp-tRNA(Asn)/Glu-tRNA(Gln) amidotransferase A subunit family amidase